MKIYFAGSIRGGRSDQDLYARLIKYLEQFGTVLTEHVGETDLTGAGEKGLSDRQIYKRDIAWLEDADSVVAEVTTPSLGVGYELGRAEAIGKPVLCLFRSGSGLSLSAMLAGNEQFRCVEYVEWDELRAHIDRFLAPAVS